MARALVKEIKDTRKNYLINGDMRISQRGTSFTSIADSTYNLDRHVYFKTGTMVHNLTQDTDVPTVVQAGCLFQNSLRLNLTTPDTAIAAGDRVEISQIMEGYNFANLAQKPFTLSFWVKATLPGTYCVYFRNSGADRSYIAEYTINAVDTWEQKVITVSASPSAGTWNYGNGIGLRIGWTLAAGTTFQTTANAWNTGNFLATANQINGVNTGATDFRITGVMLNEGSYAAPFRLFSEDYESELLNCYRYYWRADDPSITQHTVAVGRNITTALCRTEFIYPIDMRNAPVLVNPNHAHFLLYASTSSGTNTVTGTTAIFFGRKSSTIDFNSGVANLDPGGANMFVRNNASAFFAFDAEL